MTLLHQFIISPLWRINDSCLKLLILLAGKEQRKKPLLHLFHAIIINSCTCKLHISICTCMYNLNCIWTFRNLKQVNKWISNSSANPFWMYTTSPWRGTFMACTLNALLLGIQTIKVYVSQTVCHGFPLVELVQGPRRKFCYLPDSMLIRLHDTGGILMPCNALKRENHTI